MIPDVDPLTVALIRALNSGSYATDRMTDWDLVQTFGNAAQPIADALRQAIRDEIRKVAG